MKKILLITLCLSGSILLHAQLALTLQGCRDLAVGSNTSVQIDQENAEAAKYMKRSTIARFFPQFSANGAYSWQSKRIKLLPETYTDDWGSISPSGLSLNSELGQIATTLFPEISSFAGGVYGDLYNRFNLNTTHLFVGQVGVTQPIFVGGKIRESYIIARSVERITKMKAAKNQADLIVSVDEAYWRVVSVTEKKVLATKYVQLLKQLESNIGIAMEEGVATKADLLKVRVKLNEAEASLAQAEDGLELSKMALCQLIGLPLSTDIMLDQSGLDSVLLSNGEVDIEQVLSKRQEMQMLEETQKMAKAGVRLVSSTLQPNIVATANYIVTNPNVHNGFQNSFSGMWQAGVVVNIPLAHPSDILMVQAAKHKAKTVELQMQEAKEKIELQATQSAQKVWEANKKLIHAKAAIANAEENLRFAQESYEEGVITSSDLLMAQTAWQKAYSDRIDAAIELRMAEVTLKKNTGNL